ncbi:MAG: pyrimidine 5'-nucleotidase [Planktomarina sp.]
MFPMTPNFSQIDTWVFDLDNTLYPARCNLFDQISALMAEFVMDYLKVDRVTADHLRTVYYAKHGTTLAGLMDEHSMDPYQFLIDVHDIDFSVLPPAPVLAAQIAALPGRKIIYTNGTAPYARNVIAARGLNGLFDKIYGVEHAGFRPKPERAAFDRVFGLDGFDPKSAVMFEDEARNLKVPHTLGMGTVHITDNPLDDAFIQHSTPDLSDFLTQITDIPAARDTLSL